LGGQTNIVADVAFSADGNLLAARSISGEINLWEIDWKGFGALKAESISLINGTNWFGSLAFSPDGRYLAYGSYYEGIKLWNIQRESLASLYLTEPSQGIIRTVAFSADGSTLLAGSFGELEVWRTRQTVATPRYFKRYSEESYYLLATGESPIIGDLPERLLPIGDTGSHLDLYQADELLPFDLLVPTHLPEQVHFMEAQLLQDGGAALRYQVENPSGTNAILYVLEYPVTTRELAFPVGLQAQVVDVNLESTYAEYVQGDWVAVEKQQPGSTPHETWQWEDTQPVQYLRWDDDQVFVTIYYQEKSTESQPGAGTSLDSPLLVGDWQADTGLEQEDLVQIALGMEALPGYIPSDTVFVSYQIQEGDTCYGIAANFGTSLEALVGLNEKLGDCSLIRTDDVIVVPVNSVRVDVDQADLDCDGQDERLQVVPALGTTGEALAYSVYLQAISDIGIYQDVWQLTAKGEESDSLSYPMLNQLYDCQIFVALKVIKAGVPELHVYRWADGQMKPVLEKGMDILALDSYRNTMTVREQVVDPASGVCQPWDVTYKWDGQQFGEIERIIDPTGGACQ
jgi:WD40 repeat protein